MCKAYNLKQFEKYFYTPCEIMLSFLSSTFCLNIGCLLACAYFSTWADGGSQHCVEALSLLYEKFNPVTDAERITKWSGLPCH